ncbi:MAG: PaaI family thioesterase [Rhodospirillales bacterium]
MRQDLDPKKETEVRESFAQQGLMTSLGATLELLEPGRCLLAAPFDPALSQQHGFFHGGFIGALGDSAGGYAGLSLMPPGAEVLTVEYKVNFLRPAKGERMEALGQVIKPGRSLTVTTVEVSVLEAGARRLVAILQQTLMQFDPAASRQA